MIYLDNPATSMRKPKQVLDAMYRNTVNYSVNAGRGSHSASLAGINGIMNTQEELALLFNIPNPDRIAFTQNATYALNMAICGLLKKGDHAVITSMEHNSVLRPVHKTCEYTMVSANENGEINPKDIEAAIRDNTKLVAVTHASNVCGTIMPVYDIGKICKKHNIPLLLDCAQTAGIVPVDVQDMNISLLAFSGHKGLMGPLGTGGLYVREDVELSPIIVGGTGSFSKSLVQPESFPEMLHSGTMNTPAIMSLGTAAGFVRKAGLDRIFEHEMSLAKKLYSELKNIPNVTVYGLEKGNRNGTVAFNFDGIDSQTVADALGKDYGICVRGGYHCAYPAHVTLGTEKTGAVRVGFGYFSTMKELDRLAESVYKMSKNSYNI